MSGINSENSFDAIVMAGDRGAYRAVYGENKALLEINGIPLVSYVIAALQRSRYVARIFVVGPREKLGSALEQAGSVGRGPKEVVLVPQWDTVIENAVNTFRATLPVAKEDGSGLSPEELQSRYEDRAALVLGADIPLLSTAEVDEFIEGCDLSRYDFVAGMTSEETLRPYYPRQGNPGIRFVYFHFRDSLERQNNMHMIRIFRILNQEGPRFMYQYRYQKRWWNVLLLLWSLIRFPGMKPRMILKFCLLHLCRLLHRAPWNPLQGLLRRFLVKSRLEKDISKILNARFGTTVTTYGGAALDVDNEEHFQVIRRRFDQWVAFQDELQKTNECSSKTEAA